MSPTRVRWHGPCKGPGAQRGADERARRHGRAGRGRARGRACTWERSAETSLQAGTAIG